MSEWIPWSGGPRPVERDTIVEVKLRDAPNPDRAEEWSWRHLGSSEDIVAYRVVQDTAVSTEREQPEIVDKPASLSHQVGGDHYKRLGDYQPIQVMQRWMHPDAFIGFCVGNAIKYLCRDKVDRLEDLKKARHYLDICIEFMEGR